MSTVDPLRLILSREEGPLNIHSLSASGIDATYSMWSDITASESYPAEGRPAYYILTVAKPVETIEQIPYVEAELLRAFELVALAWPFSGGSIMPLQTESLQTAPGVVSNASEVREQLLARQGHLDISVDFNAAAEVISAYSQAPMRTAVLLAQTMHANPRLLALLRYFYLAQVEFYLYNRGPRSSWFVQLFKIREMLKREYGGNERKTREALNISSNDWSFFGKVLNNNDLRHAEQSGAAPPVKRGEVDKLFVISRTWITALLREKGLLF